uniref:Dickkopf N-terminal cysteine-rich domain-containing protein n=1 Tax=Neogobius melanostomus TaxID=47308 RepID=A0A8C6SXX5_9GOBI
RATLIRFRFSCDAFIMRAAGKGANPPCSVPQMYQCMSDLECHEGSYCRSSPGGVARCHRCRRRKRRCHRDGMCCPGNLCSNSELALASLSDAGARTSWRRRGRADVKDAAGKGQVGDPCLRSLDCSDGLCCARHFWTRICKPVLQEAQVCTRQRRKGAQRGLELFQRCPCGPGLSCRALRDATPAVSSLLIPVTCQRLKPV